MEKPSQLFDVGIVCALPEEARAFLGALQHEGTLEERISPRYHYSYRFAALKNDRDELLYLLVSWLPHLWSPGDDTAPLTRSGGLSATHRHHDWNLSR